MNLYRKLESEFEPLKQLGLVHFKPEKRNVTVHGYELLKDDVNVILKYGYGLNIERTSYIVPIKEIGQWIKNNFVPKIKQVTAESSTGLHTYKYSLAMSKPTENNITSLRNHLFEAIRKLEGGTMKPDEAKSMAQLAQTIINSAKLELDYKRMIEEQPIIPMLNG